MIEASGMHYFETTYQAARWVKKISQPTHHLPAPPMLVINNTVNPASKTTNPRGLRMQWGRGLSSAQHVADMRPRRT